MTETRLIVFLEKPLFSTKRVSPDKLKYYYLHVYPCSLLLSDMFKKANLHLAYILTDLNYATLTPLYIFQKTVECKLYLLRLCHHELALS